MGTSTSATNQQQQCSSVTSTGLSSGDLGAKNTVFSEVSNVAGKQGDKANEGKVSPNNMKKSLVDYDPDSDEDEADEDNKNSPKKEDSIPASNEVEMEDKSEPALEEVTNSENVKETSNVSESEPANIESATVKTNA